MDEVNLDHLPRHILGLNGRDDRFDESVYRVLNADYHLLREYRSDAHPAVWLYIGYYGTAKGGRPSHVPQACYTGQGFSIACPKNDGRQPPRWKLPPVVRHLFTTHHRGGLGLPVFFRGFLTMPIKARLSVRARAPRGPARRRCRAGCLARRGGRGRPGVDRP
ncbi:MAG: exosortase-associated EpsI family protein [Bacteroidetes bacterium]|nr:exosortase-associated EpsI family protein [Bacteroidota bacterium]